MAHSLPPGVRPIIVTDAGFKTPWWQAVAAQGWRWLGRIRGKDFVCAHGKWQRWSLVAADAGSQPTDLGECQVIRSRPTAARLVLYRQAPKHRRAKTVFGKRSKSRRATRYARSGTEAWLLAASPDMQDKTPTEIVRLYRARMQIEESFRDLKSAEFGLGFECHGTRKQKRLETLLLIAALATWVLWLVGQMAAEPAIAATLRPTARPTSLSRLRLALEWCAAHAPSISAAAVKAGLADLARYSTALAAGRA